MPLNLAVLWLQTQLNSHQIAVGAIQNILAMLDQTPVSARFVTITHRTLDGKEVEMAVNLINDMISNIPMEFDNVAGAVVSPPANDTITLSVTDSTGAVNPVATAAMGSDGKSVDVTPAQPGDTSGNVYNLNFSGIVAATATQPAVTLTATQQIAFTADQAVASVHFLTTGITTRPLGT